MSTKMPQSDEELQCYLISTDYFTNATSKLPQRCWIEWEPTTSRYTSDCNL